jgi:hypothetical protein
MMWLGFLVLWLPKDHMMNRRGLRDIEVEG